MSIPALESVAELSGSSINFIKVGRKHISNMLNNCQLIAVNSQQSAVGKLALSDMGLSNLVLSQTDSL